MQLIQHSTKVTISSIRKRFSSNSSARFSPSTGATRPLYFETYTIWYKITRRAQWLVYLLRKTRPSTVLTSTLVDVFADTQRLTYRDRYEL